MKKENKLKIVNNLVKELSSDESFLNFGMGILSGDEELAKSEVEKAYIRIKEKQERVNE